MKRITFIILTAWLAAAAVAQRVSVLGDSYSTFEDFMTPSTNELWYYARNDSAKTDVNRVEDTWWWQLIHDGGYQLEVNNSYSGATIGYRGYDGNDYTERSFLRRMYNVGRPDILLVFGGTNDNWAGEPMGEYKWGSWQWGDFYTFRPAMAYMVDWIRLHHPNTRVLYIINSDLKDETVESMVTVCEHYNVPYVRLKDISKRNGHPDVHGMREIARQVAEALGGSGK